MLLSGILLFSLGAIKISWAVDDNRVVACKSDNGKTWFFSIGKDVFETSFATSTGKEFFPTILNINSSEKLVPPDPTAPVGCRNNPQQLQTYSGLNVPILSGGKYHPDIPSSIYELQMSRFRPDGKTIYDVAIANFADILHYCASLPFEKRWPDGSIYCTDVADNLDSSYNNGAHFARVYVLSSKTYQTPYGTNFYLTCTFIFGCDSSYQLTDDIYLSYNWLPRDALRPIQPPAIILVDEALKKTLNTWLVSDYKWPN